MDFAAPTDDHAPRAPLAGRTVFWLTIYLGTLAALGPIHMYLPTFPRIAEHFCVAIPEVQKTLACYFFGVAI